jgi:ribosomal protein S18 acetylase RimI-like enzyme
MTRPVRTAKPFRLSHTGPSTPSGIRTRATGVKGRRPRPLDDGGLAPAYRPARQNPPVRIRPAREDELDAVAALLDVRPEHLRSDWELSGFDLGVDAWVVEADGRIAGFAAVLPGERLVHAAGDRRTADALLVLAAERARELGLSILQLTVSEESEFIARNPFALDRVVLRMTRDLGLPIPAPEWPPAVAVRTFETRDAQVVHALLDEAYGAWDGRYVPLPHDDWVRWMTGDIDFDPTVWWLAERDGELAGCALHWRSGFLKDLVVRESERGRGLGAALVNHGLAEFARRGSERVGLKVDSTNPTGAVRLYERLGFTVESREETWVLSL